MSNIYSNIILALMSTGEAFVTDLRKDQPTRIEICELLDGVNEEGQLNRIR